MNKCKKCGAVLDTDDIGIYKKMINREAGDYWCKRCLAGYLGCGVEVIERKIRQFKDNGCLLFFPDQMLKA